MDDEQPGPSQASSEDNVGGASRKRAFKGKKKNFTEAEIEILVDEVQENYNSLFGEKSLRLPLKVRNSIWEQIVVAVNAVGVDKRTALDLKKKFSDIKSQVKQKQGLIARDRRQTGGGPGLNINMSPLEEKIASMLQIEQIEGIGQMDVLSLSLQQGQQETDQQMEPSLILENVENTEPEPVQPDFPANMESPPYTQDMQDTGLTPAQVSFFERHAERMELGFNKIVDTLLILNQTWLNHTQTISRDLQDVGRVLTTNLVQLSQNAANITHPQVSFHSEHDVVSLPGGPVSSERGTDNITDIPILEENRSFGVPSPISTSRAPSIVPSNPSPPVGDFLADSPANVATPPSPVEQSDEIEHLPPKKRYFRTK